MAAIMVMTSVTFRSFHTDDDDDDDGDDGGSHCYHF